MRHGEELDELFEQADMGIGSLARHRSGITHIKTLKNREYAARGLPFIYSEMDSDFEGKPYILKAKADGKPGSRFPLSSEIHQGANAISLPNQGVRPIAFVGEPNE